MKKDFQTHMLFRCTKRKYAEDFRNKGSMKFNYPIYWIDEEKKLGIVLIVYLYEVKINSFIQFK